jgi:hypothetical protein
VLKIYLSKPLLAPSPALRRHLDGQNLALNIRREREELIPNASSSLGLEDSLQGFQIVYLDSRRAFRIAQQDIAQHLDLSDAFLLGEERYAILSQPLVQIVEPARDGIAPNGVNH